MIFWTWFSPRPRKGATLSKQAKECHFTTFLRYLLLLIPLSGCTTVEAVGHARALGDRQVDHARTVLDARQEFYGERIDAVREACRTLTTIANLGQALCMQNGGCDLEALADAYRRAADCWKEAEPPMSDIVRYFEEIKQLREVGR